MSSIRSKLARVERLGRAAHDRRGREVAQRQWQMRLLCPQWQERCAGLAMVKPTDCDRETYMAIRNELAGWREEPKPYPHANLRPPDVGIADWLREWMDGMEDREAKLQAAVEAARKRLGSPRDAGCAAGRGGGS